MAKNKEIKRKIQAILNAKLIVATKSSFPGNVRRLLKKGANSNSIDENRNTVLYIAARAGDAKIVHLLLKKGAKNNISKNITPLDIAVILEHLEVIQILIKEDKAIDLNQNKDAPDPLSLAIFHEKLGSVRILLESGAKVLAKHIPRNIKCRITHEIVKLLIPYLLLEDPSIAKLKCIQEYQELSNTWEDSLTQIKKMQTIFISEVYNYADLLKLDFSKLIEGISTNNLIKVNSLNLSENFVNYSAILKKKLEELVTLKERQNKCITLPKNISFFNDPPASTSNVLKEKTVHQNYTRQK